MHNKYTAYSQKAFTLPEIIIAISVMLILLFISYDFIKTGFRISRFESEQEIAIREARKATETVERDIRMAADSANGEYTIAVATEQN